MRREGDRLLGDIRGNLPRLLDVDEEMLVELVPGGGFCDYPHGREQLAPSHEPLASHPVLLGETQELMHSIWAGFLLMPLPTLYGFFRIVRPCASSV